MRSPMTLRMLVAWIVGAVALVSAVPEFVGAGTIDFSDIPGTGYQNVSGDRYQSQGVLFSTDGAGLQVYRESPFICGTSTGTLGGPCDRRLILDFVLPGTSIPGYTDSVSFFVVNDSSPTSNFVVSLFGPGNVLLAEIPGLAFTPFDLFRPQADIQRVVLTPLGSLDGMQGPIVFGAIAAQPGSVVPEPASLFLLGTGFGVIAAWRRRK